MASIIRDLIIGVSAQTVWSAVRDVGCVHVKLVPGLVSGVHYDNGIRPVAFANGLEIEEKIISIDDAARRLAYAVQNRAAHHQATMQVDVVGKDQSRFIWTTDVLPDDAADRFAAVMDQALPIIKLTLESGTQ